jgi:putative transposase
VFVEDLDLQKMSEKKDDLKLGKEISDLGYGNFLNYLTYKLEWENKKLIRVNRYFASSKTCSTCGYRNDNLKLSTRSWICPSCGVKHNRDINASINIKKEGIRMIFNPSS